MATTVIGADLNKGAGTLSGYYIQSATVGGADIDMEDFEDGADGSRISRFVYKVDDKVSLELLAAGTMTEGDITTDFPEGEMAAATGYTAFFVDSCQINKSRGAWRVNVSMTNIGIT
jgi:hypothetical protein